MVFTLASTLKEWLDDNNFDVKDRERQRIQKELDEAEERRRQGTAVTPETFNAWAKAFYAERRAIEEKKAALEQKVKLTGRQLFESSPELALSDTSYVEQGDETVAVDWNLFSQEVDASLDEETE
jgi:tRNA(Ile)-lysidine synthase TilS/MesJ